MSDVASALEGMFGRILREVDETKITAYRSFPEAALEGAVETARKGDPEQFHRLVVARLDDVIDGLLLAELPAASPKLAFLMKNYDFVERHVSAFVRDNEGYSCHVDKARTILRAISRFLTTGKPIEFDYSQQYTYSLPKKALDTHEKIIEFFDAIYGLYYGRPGKFFEIMQASASSQPPAL